MSPEQLMAGDLDPRSDLYAAGAVLYECLTGKPVFDAPTIAALIVAQVDEVPADPRTLNPAIPHDLALILLKERQVKEGLAHLQNVAELYENAGFDSKAVAVYRQFLKYDADNPEANRKLVAVLARQGRHEEVERCRQRLEAIDTNQFLRGDVSGNRVVTVADLGQVNAQIAQVVGAGNFLRDVNASGTLTVADKGIANTQITKALAALRNVAPVVNAGADQSITLPATASLNGIASDDGLPSPPGAMSLSWTKVSGPGTVTFASPGSVATTASFDVAGTYVLRLVPSDGSLPG